MSLDQVVSQLPKSLVAVLAISGTVFILYLANPPHTICDTQADTLVENTSGVLFPAKVKKATLPPQINQTREDCRSGHSSGACYQYFVILKSLAQEVHHASSECQARIFEITEVRKALSEGIEMMALLAWGNEPPATPAARFGWMQEFELSVFCRLKDVYTEALGEEEWNNQRLAIAKKYPDQAPAGTLDFDRPRAYLRLSENEIWSRSIFSVRCDSLM